MFNLTSVGLFLFDIHCSFKSVFNTLTLKKVFWKTKTVSKNMEYCFLVASATTESKTFPYKTALSEASTKWAQNGPVTKTEVCHWLFCFFKNSIWVQQSLIKSWFNVSITQVSIFILFVSTWVLFQDRAANNGRWPVIFAFWPTNFFFVLFGEYLLDNTLLLSLLCENYWFQQN